MPANFLQIYRLLRGLLWTCLLYLHVGVASASFYQAETMAAYCSEYIKYLNLENTVNQLEAGLCSGYIASTIEMMVLSERLCKRDQLNLDNVVKQFMQEVESNEIARKHSATYVIVDILQKNYGCE